jgi:hypothetical protein
MEHIFYSACMPVAVPGYNVDLLTEIAVFHSSVVRVTTGNSRNIGEDPNQSPLLLTQKSLSQLLGI